MLASEILRMFRMHVKIDVLPLKVVVSLTGAAVW